MKKLDNNFPMNYTVEGISTVPSYWPDKFIAFLKDGLFEIKLPKEEGTKSRIVKVEVHYIPADL